MDSSQLPGIKPVISLLWEEVPQHATNFFAAFLNREFTEPLQDGTARIFCPSSTFRTHVSRVAPGWDLLKDLLLTELPRRSTLKLKIKGWTSRQLFFETQTREGMEVASYFDSSLKKTTFFQFSFDNFFSPSSSASKGYFSNFLLLMSFAAAAAAQDSFQTE